MDNSKYLALVDLMGKDGADQVRENAADFLASLDCEFKPEIRHECRHEYPGLDNCVDWAFVPVLTESLDTELVTLPWWRCEYCGSINSSEALYCGQCGPSHCGAPNPRCNEPPRGVLYLREPELEQFSSFYVVKETDHPAPEMHFYPEQSMAATYPGGVWRQPGKTARDFKLELGTRLLSAFQKAIKGAMSLC